METLKVKVTKAGVTHQGAPVDKEEVIALGAVSARALIKEGLAELMGEEGGVNAADTNQDGAGSGKVGDHDQNHSKESKGALEMNTGVQLPTDEEAAANKEADRELTVKALDDQYKRDELAEAAKEAGVEFAYDARKADIIQAVIDQEKAAALLK